jgi:hypothetical protein
MWCAGTPSSRCCMKAQPQSSTVVLQSSWLAEMASNKRKCCSCWAVLAATGVLQCSSVTHPVLAASHRGSAHIEFGLAVWTP